MAIRNLESAVRVTLDGHQQRFRFESADGNPIPHNADELVVKLNGEPLIHREDYGLSKDGETTIVILLKVYPRGNELSIERHTQLVQTREFRRAKGFTVDEMERGLDHITRAVQDAIRRLSDVERIVQVEHRVVEIPADVPAPDPVLVAALEQHMARSGMTDQDKADLAEVIATVVVKEVIDLTNDMAKRVAYLESQMNRLAIATSEDAAA